MCCAEVDDLLFPNPAANAGPDRGSCRYRRPGPGRLLRPAVAGTPAGGRNAATSSSPSSRKSPDFLPGGVPLPPQRFQHHRVNHQHNVVGAGVVRAELGTLGGVEGALEQGAEYGRLDVAPVLAGGLSQALQCATALNSTVSAAELNRSPLKCGNLVSPEQTTVGHLPEEVGNCLIEPRRVAKLLADNTSKQPLRVAGRRPRRRGKIRSDSDTGPNLQGRHRAAPYPPRCRETGWPFPA